MSDTGSSPDPRRADALGGDARALPPSPVLVVDDDAVVRDVARRFLESRGYQVKEAESGRAALELLHGGFVVSAVVTDLKMADGSGGWLLAHLAYEFPLLLSRVVVITANAEGTSAAHVAARWRCPIVAKPFTARQLVSALDRLGEADAGAL